MPDPTTAGAGTTALATPPVQTAPPPSGTTTDATNQNGHVSEADFSHPEFGQRLRNLHNGLQEKSGRLAETEKKHADLEARHNQLTGWIQANRDKLVKFMETQARPPSNPENPESDEDKRLREATENIGRSSQIDQAMFEEYHILGNGDIAKGRDLWESGEGAKYGEVLRIMAEGNPRDHLRLARQLLRASTGSPQPTPTVTPPPPVAGTAASEMGRGSPQGPAADTSMKDHRDMLRAAGFASEADYLHALGRL